MSLVRTVVETLTGSGFAAVVDPATWEIRIDLPTKTRTLLDLLRLVETTLADEDNGYAVIRLDGHSYVLEAHRPEAAAMSRGPLRPPAVG